MNWAIRMSKLGRYINQILMAISVLAFLAAMFHVADSYTTMRAVEAQGTLGQIIGLEEYQKAQRDFKIYGVIASGAFIMTMILGFGVIDERLDELAPDEE